MGRRASRMVPSVLLYEVRLKCEDYGRTRKKVFPSFLLQVPFSYRESWIQASDASTWKQRLFCLPPYHTVVQCVLQRTKKRVLFRFAPPSPLRCSKKWRLFRVENQEGWGRMDGMNGSSCCCWWVSSEEFFWGERKEWVSDMCRNVLLVRNGLRTEQGAFLPSFFFFKKSSITFCWKNKSVFLVTL